jgi:DNA-binding CsgD family transcriptional regulator
MTGSLFQRLTELATPGTAGESRAYLEGQAQQGNEPEGHNAPKSLALVAGPATRSPASPTPMNQASHGAAPLSKREMELLRELGRGRSNKEIGDVLFITAQTVKNHVTSILRKLDVDDRTQAVLKALRSGWISLEETIPEEATQQLPASASALRWAGRRSQEHWSRNRSAFTAMAWKSLLRPG